MPGCDRVHCRRSLPRQRLRAMRRSWTGLLRRDQLQRGSLLRQQPLHLARLNLPNPRRCLRQQQLRRLRRRWPGLLRWRPLHRAQRRLQRNQLHRLRWNRPTLLRRRHLQCGQPGMRGQQHLRALRGGGSTVLCQRQLRSLAGLQGLGVRAVRRPRPGVLPGQRVSQWRLLRPERAHLRSRRRCLSGRSGHLQWRRLPRRHLWQGWPGVLRQRRRLHLAVHRLPQQHLRGLRRVESAVLRQGRLRVGPGLQPRQRHVPVGTGVVSRSDGVTRVAQADTVGVAATRARLTLMPRLQRGRSSRCFSVEWGSQRFA